MKLSQLRELLDYWKDFFDSKRDGLDPEVIIRVDPNLTVTGMGEDELPLVNDSCESVSNIRDGRYLCLFTYNENE